MDTRTHDELSIMLDQEEYDDISMAESLISENQRDSELTELQVFPFLPSIWLTVCCLLVNLRLHESSLFFRSSLLVIMSLLLASVTLA